MRLVPVGAEAVAPLAVLALAVCAGCRFDPHGLAVGQPRRDSGRSRADGRPLDARGAERRRPDARRPDAPRPDAPRPDAPPPDSESCVPLATPAADAACAPPPGPSSFHSVSTTRAPTVDGCPGEWSSASFYTLDRCDAGFDAVLVSGGAPELHWLEVASRWDAGGLYFAIQVADDSLACVPTGTACPSLPLYDEVEIYLDRNTARTGPYGSTSHQFMVECGGLVEDYGTSPATFAPAGVTTAVATTPIGWFLETGVTWPALGFAAPPAPGTRLAFDLVVSDGDGTKQREQLGAFFGGLATGCTASCPPPGGHACCCGTAADGTVNPQLFCENDNWGLLTLDP